MRFAVSGRVILGVVVGFAVGAGCGVYFAKNPISFSDSDVVCLDGTVPDKNGCCLGEVYTDMGEQGFNCCPESGGDCFPPMR